MVTLDEIKIIVKLTAGELGQNAMRAMITLDFGGVFKIKGFRIQSSKFEGGSGDRIWVTPPSYFAKGGYHPIFFSEDKDWWKRLEAKIIEAYRDACMSDAVRDLKEDS
ncbi:SpoVG family protein [Patescibacteria group bacterium]|nr:SpoVG family protein [Patescibacteria group bacterium]